MKAATERTYVQSKMLLVRIVHDIYAVKSLP